MLEKGFAKFKALTANAEAAVRAASIDARVEKVEDLREIMKFKVISTPALVLDGKVPSTDKVLTVDAIKQVIAP